jgi:hypothetical protein
MLVLQDAGCVCPVERMMMGRWTGHGDKIIAKILLEIVNGVHQL